MNQTLTPLKPLGTLDQIFTIDCVTDSKGRQEHVDSAIARKLPVCTFQKPRNGKLAIVASGPSGTEYVEELTNWDGEIWGINGAFAWMRHRGIKPKAFVGIDPEWFLKDYLIDPPDDAVYYLAAQVHPQVFDHLRDKNVQLWFQADTEVKFPAGTETVPGGSTCLGRSIYLAVMLGWSDVHIFGGDSSFTHKTHVYGGALPTNYCFAEAAGEVFKTTRQMLTQACDLVVTVQNFPGKIAVHGHGLLQSMCQDVKNSGVTELLAEMEADEIRKMGGNRRERRAMKAKSRAA